MASIILKIIGFMYYTVTTITVHIFLNFFFRISRRPSKRFYIDNTTLSKTVLVFYSLGNLLFCFYFFKNKINGYGYFLLNEIITVSFSYIILSGFHVYGITGQICSGKTSACEYLKKRYRASIISLDEINRKILLQKDVIARIKKEFGNEVIINEYGNERINKDELKKIIFNNRLMRRKLEKITHPKVMMLFFKTLFVERFLNLKKFVFVENAILLRFNMFRMIIKGTIAICVENENVLIQRIIKRDNSNGHMIDEDTARNILKNQMSLNEFKYKSDIVIYNNDNYQSLELKIDEIMKNLVHFSKKNKIFIN